MFSFEISLYSVVLILLMTILPIYIISFFHLSHTTHYTPAEAAGDMLTVTN